MTVMPDTADTADLRLVGDEWTPRTVHVVVAMLVMATFFLFRLGRDVPLTSDECLVGQTTREMDIANDWLLPRFSGELRPDRPPLAYWTAGVFWWATGRLDALSLRLVSAVSGLACAIALWALARTMFGKRVAFVTGIIFGSAAGALYYTHNAAVDMQLTLWCLLSVLGFEHALRAQKRMIRRAWLAMFYACLGIAMLAAMPMPLFIVLPGLLTYLLVTRRTRELPRLFLLPGLVIFVAACGSWVIATGRSPAVGFDSLWTMWHQRILPWYDSGVLADATTRLYYPLAILAAMTLPWTLSLPETLVAPFLKRYAAERRSLWLPWCLLAANLVIFSLARFKRPEYMLPSLPWAALLLGVVVERLFFRSTDRKELGQRGLVLLAALLVLGFGVATSEVVQSFGDPPWPVLWMTMLVLWLGGSMLLLALVLFEARCFRTSLLSVALAGAFVVTLARVTLVPLTTTRPNYFGFAEGLRQAVSIPAADDLRWLCRPNPCLVFHTNQTCKSALSELELARRQRKARATAATASPESIVAEETLRRLRATEPFFAVGEAKWLETWSAKPEYTQAAHTIYRYPSFDGDPDDDLVVFTNDAGTAFVRREGKRLIRYAGSPDTRAAKSGPVQASGTAPARE